MSIAKQLTVHPFCNIIYELLSMDVIRSENLGLLNILPNIVIEVAIELTYLMQNWNLKVVYAIYI